MSSNLKVNSIVPAAGSNVAIGTAGGTISCSAPVSGITTFSDGVNVTSGNVTVGLTTITSSNLIVNGTNYPNAGPLSNRNIIINGAMQVDQRGTATGITGDNFGGPDRYKCFISGAGTWTLSQQADAPSGTGLYYSYKFQCTSTGTLSAGSYLGHRTFLEGYDSARLNGQQFTISFWVKCNKTGTMTCEPFDGSSGATQSVSKQFTINAADTWEYKTITFPANPHNYPANNAQALILHWWLSAGSNWTSTASTGEWTNFANGFRAYGCNIDLTDSTSNYFQITGIQLEVGTVATPFEHRSYGDELARCMRYAYKLTDALLGDTQNASDLKNPVLKHPLQMRANPTLESGASFNVSSGSAGTPAISNGRFVGVDGKNQVAIFNNDNNWGSVWVAFTGVINAEL